MQVSLASFFGGSPAGAGTGAGGLTASPSRMDPTRLSPPSGVNGLISMFEVLNTTSATPSSTSLYTRTHRRWRYSCPSIDIPRSLARHNHNHHSYGNEYRISSQQGHGGGHGNYQERHMSSLSMHSFHLPSVQSLNHDTSFSPTQSRTPATSSVVSVASDPARLSEPKIPADSLTVSERRKLFETSTSERPRTSGGEQSSLTSKFSLVSSFTTGPARQLAPPAQIHTKQDSCHHVDASSTIDRTYGEFSSSNAQDKHGVRACSRDNDRKDKRQPDGRGFHRDWNREWGRDLDWHHPYAMRGPISTDDSQKLSNWMSQVSRSPASMDTVPQTSQSNITTLLESNIMSMDGAIVSTAALSPMRTATCHPLATGTISPRHCKPEIMASPNVERVAVLSGGKHHRELRNSHDNDVVPDKRPAPRHVSVPEWYMEDPQEFNINHKLGIEQLVESPCKPRTPDTFRFLDVSQTHAAPGRASLPPPASKSALVTSPSSQSYAVGAAAFSSTSSPSVQSEYKGTVRNLKKLFDTSPSSAKDIQANDPHRRHRATTESPVASEHSTQQIQLARLESPLDLSELSPGVNVHLGSAVVSPDGSSRKTVSAIPNSPLRSKIGQFESLSQPASLRPISPGVRGSHATNEDSGARRRSLEAIQWFMDVQSSRKSKGLKSWKKLPNLWARTTKEVCLPHQRKKQVWSVPLQDSPEIPTDFDPSGKPNPQSLPAVPRKPAQLVGSRPLVARSVPVVACAGLERHTAWKQDNSPSKSNSTESHRRDGPIEAYPQAANARQQPFITPVQWPTSDRHLNSRQSRPSVNPQASYSAFPLRSIRDNNYAVIPAQQVLGPSSRNTRSGKYGSTTKVTWGRRQISTKNRTVVSNVQCGLQHPKPVRLYDANRLVSLCRDQTIKRAASRGYETFQRTT
jgi:hypothetical protein